MNFTQNQTINVYKNFKLIFKDAFNIKGDEICIIIGKNGSGKTTLAKVLSKYLPVSDESIKSIHYVYQPQESIFMPGTVKENLLMFLNNKETFTKMTDGGLGKEIQELYDSTIKKLLQDDISEISGGERQIIAFFRSILVNESNGTFDGIIFDELEKQLESKHRKAIINFFGSQSLIKGLCIFISHDFDFINSIIEIFAYKKDITFIQMSESETLGDNSFIISNLYTVRKVNYRLGDYFSTRNHMLEDWSFLNQNDLLKTYYMSNVRLLENHTSQEELKSYKIVKIVPFYGGLFKLTLSNGNDKLINVLYHIDLTDNTFNPTKTYYYHE